MSIEATMHQMQSEIVLRYSPTHFLPPLPERARAPIDDEIRTAPDFTWMVVRGVRYTFKPGIQANTIRVLFEAWKASGCQDGSGLSEQAIGRQVESSAQRFRIDRAFEGSKALDVILRPSGKGQWALFLGRDSEGDDRRAEESTAA
jgi:hypothetical protein